MGSSFWIWLFYPIGHEATACKNKSKVFLLSCSSCLPIASSAVLFLENSLQKGGEVRKELAPKIKPKKFLNNCEKKRDSTMCACVPLWTAYEYMDTYIVENLITTEN